jgi:hypothetical protein
VKPLTCLINKSLILRIFPDKALLDNDRPISLLPSLSKVYEKIIDQLRHYFTQNNLLFSSQYGLGLNILWTLLPQNWWIGSLNRLILAVFMDLSKAFDTLDHSILIAKLRYYGLQTDAANLL